MSSELRYTVMAFVAVIAVAGLGYLVFGVFGIHTAFVDEEVDEAGPAFESGAGDSGTGSEVADGQLGSAEFDAAMEDAAANPVTVDEDMMPGEVVTVAEGSFAGRAGHAVSGDALVLNDGTEQRFLRLQSFESTNGPDLNVYLRADDGEFVDLGDLKGNIGDQNYEISTEVDLDRFHLVQIWCVRFGVNFGDADLA
jgi:hypothetical protein